MFQFPGLALSRSDEVSLVRFPHSDIPGSMLACSSPRLIAACHVLHRRLVPRHPPCALLHLTSTNRWSRIKETCTKRCAFHPKPRTTSCAFDCPYEVPKTFSHRPMLSISSGTDPKTGRGCRIAIRVSRKQAGRLSRTFRSAVRPTYSASPERR